MDARGNALAARSSNSVGLMALPLGGAALSAFSLCVAFLFAFGPADRAQAAATRAMPASLPQPTAAAPKRHPHHRRLARERREFIALHARHQTGAGKARWPGSSSRTD